MSHEESPAFSQQRIDLQQAPKSLAGKLISLILGIAFLTLAFMFSLIALAVVAVGGVALWGWLWWKTRAIRKQMREQPAQDSHPGFETGRVIDGEVIRETTGNTPSGYLPR